LSEEGADARGVKVEHLRTSQLAVSHLVQTEDFLVKAATVGVDATLVPVDHDFVAPAAHD
jgi:hypothetical protein